MQIVHHSFSNYNHSICYYFDTFICKFSTVQMLSVLVFEWILLVTVPQVILYKVILLCPGLAPCSPNHWLLIKTGHRQSWKKHNIQWTFSKKNWIQKIYYYYMVESCFDRNLHRICCRIRRIFFFIRIWCDIKLQNFGSRHFKYLLAFSIFDQTTVSGWRWS